MKISRDKSLPAKTPAPLQLQAAYAICRSISRATARNFYYAFLALPREKRNAICAVYAFMRHADDISDEPGISLADRRMRLDDWLARLQRVIGGEPTDEPVLLALADAQRRYAIPLVWLEALIAGTLMDVPPVSAAADAAPHASVSAGGSGAEVATQACAQAAAAQYETFSDLYNYCYHVASVVGLICIRIFGYRDGAAEPLAEQCGVAFQLTNIIRDVKEDAGMGRIYLPREDLDRFGISATELLSGGSAANAPLAQRFRPLLEFEAQRAREFYAAAERLLPYIDEDSRPALWVLVTIYRKLLDKIAACQYDVFTEKVRLSFWEKFSVLARGVWQRLA